ncbi:MAG TPA: hypothetical protein DEA08_29965 [Planctomycetes bacterium]|nr:hypothetical protein [Planctomycetota bacterium]
MSRILFALVLVWICAAPASATGIVISEVMPEGAEFLELLNPGGESVDLSGYHLAGDVRFTFPVRSALAPGERILISSHKITALREAYGAALGRLLGELEGRLRREGGVLRLFDAQGVLVDALRYGEASAGRSWQRIDPTTAYRGPLNWKLAPPTPAHPAPPAALPALLLDQPRWRPTGVAGAPVPVKVRVFSPATEVRLSVRWQTRRGSGEAPLEKVAEGEGWTSWEGAIPAQPDQTLVSFSFRAVAGEAVAELVEDPLEGIPLRYFVFEGKVDPAQMPLYCLELPEASYQQLLERPERTRFRACFVAVRPGGVAEIHSGVKLQVRGGDWTREWLKRAWVVHFRASDPFEDQISLNLRSGWHDPTMLRDLLGFDAYQRVGVKSPSARWVRVHVNGRFCGLFTEVEMIDARFLERVGLAGAVLYQARPPQKNSSEEKADGRTYPLPQRYAVHWRKVTHEGEPYDDLREFIEGYSGCDTPSELEAFFEQNLEVDRYLDYLAVTVFIEHWDSLIKNYYWCLDREGTGKWSVIPWDLDRTWGDHFEQMGYNSDPILHGTKAEQIGGNRNWWNRLRDRFLSVPRYRDRLHTRLSELLRAELEPSRLINDMRHRVKAAEEVLLLDREEWGGYERERRDGEDVYLRGKFSPSKLAHGLEVLERFTRLRASFIQNSVRSYYRDNPQARPRRPRRAASPAVNRDATEEESVGGGGPPLRLLWLTGISLLIYVAAGGTRELR